jgi:hypothetical protein
MSKGEIWSRETLSRVVDTNLLMTLAGLDLGMGYEDVGIQSDGSPVVFDKCGNFGYLDPERYRFIFDSSLI